MPLRTVLTLRRILWICVLFCAVMSISSALSSAQTGGTLCLSWNCNSEPDLAGYNIYRSITSGEGYSKLNTFLMADTTCQDTGLTYGITYYYVVTAVDTVSNESGYSNEASGRISLQTVVSQETTVKGESELGGSVLPSKFELGQNYPNPFNPTTNISYTIPTTEGKGAQRTVLGIYNLQGQLVRTLVDELQGPGFYSVQWDARDSDGREVAAGIYLYRLVAGHFKATKKMIVLK